MNGPQGALASLPQQRAGFSRPLMVALLACLFALPGQAQTNRYNVLFIAVDDLRPELGCYGVKEAQTPNLDRLAKSGMLFTRHYSAVPTCGASRYALLTGRSPGRSGVTASNEALYQGKTALDSNLLPGAQTMPELFRRSGYQTACIGKISHTADGRVYAYNGAGDGRPELPNAWDALPTPFGDWKRGWGIFFAYEGGKHREDGQGHNALMEFTAKRDEDLPDGQMAREAIAQLKGFKRSGKPFFLGLGFFKPHLPFVAPKQDWDAFAGKEIPLPSAPLKPEAPYWHASAEFYKYRLPFGKKQPLDDDAARTARRAYLACVRYTDRQVGKVLDALKAEGLEKNTIVVLWGDHGWHLGEKQIWGKHSPFERAVRSTLIVRAPGVGPAGKASDALVESIDLYPTLTELCQPRFTQTHSPLDGKSFAAVLAGKKPTVRARAVSYWQDTVTVRTATHRLIARRTKDSKTFTDIALYDLSKDLDSTENLAEKEPTRAMKTSLLLTLPALFSLPSGEAQAQAPAKPNVLFIAVDDLRPELGCYGNTIIKSPNIDRIAKQGMVFQQAYCQQAVCSPSRSSLLTGRRPDSTKVWDLVTHFRAALPNANTLPQHFKNNGYHTAGLGKIYHGGYDDAPSWSVPHWTPKLRELETQKSHAYLVTDKPEEQLPDGAVAAEAVTRLKDYKKSGQPFFLAVGFVKPHLPFVSPKKYWDLYDPAKIPGADNDALPEGAPTFAGHDNGELHGYGNIPAGNPISPQVAQELRHGYYAAISYMDAQVGKLLDTLKAEGLDKNTIIVLWGDHGWQLGDHGLWHKHTNFERATHAPLILSVPGMKNAGKSTAALAEFVDIYPTLAALAGLPKPEGADGTSLAPVLEDPSVSVRKVAISQYPRSMSGKPVMGYSARDPRWRLTLWRDRKTNETLATELYDEKNDPKESVNVASKPENAGVIAELTKELDAAYKNLGAPMPTTKGEKTPQKANSDRVALFNRKDTNKDAKLSYDEFMANQADPEQAKERFKKFDTNNDGVLSREEFITMGKKV